MSNTYAAMADTTTIENITCDKINRDILQKLKDNDQGFKMLQIYPYMDIYQQHYEYMPRRTEDMGWLGYFIGKNTALQKLTFSGTIEDDSFYEEMSCNTSIQTLDFYGNGHVDIIDFLKVFHMLSPFLKNNTNLTRIQVRDCYLEADYIRQLSLAIEGCNKSLKSFECSFSYEYLEIPEHEIGDGDINDIITALSMHPQLEHIEFSGMSIGRNSSMALSTLLHYTATNLRTLCLDGNNINDEGIEQFLDAIFNGNMLEKLYLSSNRTITINGWKRVSTLLKTPDSKLNTLYIDHNNLGDDGAMLFANALTNNTTLKTLSLQYCGITREGWAPFLKLLCDKSSVNKTYSSNHTLKNIISLRGRSNMLTGIVKLVALSLATNDSEEKRQIAITKILQNHSHFDVEPFFEWEFKVLPLVIKWFTNARTDIFEDEINNKIDKMQLSTVYDFIKEFPMLYVESVTRIEISEYTALEEKLQGDELEELQQCKARALRRLNGKRPL